MWDLLIIISFQVDTILDLNPSCLLANFSSFSPYCLTKLLREREVPYVPETVLQMTLLSSTFSLLHQY